MQENHIITHITFIHTFLWNALAAQKIEVFVTKLEMMRLQFVPEFQGVSIKNTSAHKKQQHTMLYSRCYCMHVVVGGVCVFTFSAASDRTAKPKPKPKHFY